MQEELNRIVRQEVLRLVESDITCIAPGEVAEGAYYALDPERQAPLLVQISSKNDLRRRAEGVLRHVHDEEQQRLETEQEEMFEGHLQSRYPCEREGVRVYVAPGHLTDEELTANVGRLRSEANAKLRHADALEAYGQNRNSGFVVV